MNKFTRIISLPILYFEIKKGGNVQIEARLYVKVLVVLRKMVVTCESLKSSIGIII